MYKIKTYRLITPLLAMALLLVAGSSHADKAMSREQAQALVQPFYDFLSGNADADAAFANMAEDWKSHSSDTQFRDATATTKAITGLRTHVVPDLQWAIHDVMVNDSYIVIRGEGSGTPTADFFGVPASGKSFAIMSIDVHKIENGKVATTWHVENWADAIQQLKGN